VQQRLSLTAVVLKNCLGIDICAFVLFLSLALHSWRDEFENHWVKDETICILFTLVYVLVLSLEAQFIRPPGTVVPGGLMFYC